MRDPVFSDGTSLELLYVFLPASNSDFYLEVLAIWNVRQILYLLMQVIQ
jgi:hypothetical protein